MAKTTMTKKELEDYIKAVEDWLKELKQMAAVMTEDSSNPPPPPPPPPH